MNHLYFDPNFVFLGTALGRFSQCFFLYFFVVGQYIYSGPPLSSPLCPPPPTHTHNKKASYGPVKEDIKISSNIILQLQQSFLSNPLFLLVIALNHQSSTVFLVWFWWTSSHTCWSSVTQKLWFVHLSTLFKVQKLHFE